MSASPWRSVQTGNAQTEDAPCTWSAANCWNGHESWWWNESWWWWPNDGKDWWSAAENGWTPKWRLSIDDSKEWAGLREENYELRIEIAALNHRLAAEVRSSAEKSTRIDELEKQLAESHSQVEKSLSKIDGPLEKSDSEIDGLEESDTEIDDTITIECPSVRNEKLASCIALGVHTEAFEEWATGVDLHGTGKDWKTTQDGEGQAPWLAWLQSMNIPIANHATGPSEWTLSDKLCSAAKQKRTFTLDRHKSGKYNSNGCTSIICNHCLAKLVIHHSGLPAKGGQKADARLIETVNARLTQFLFTRKEIARKGLLDRTACTIERHYPGRVVQQKEFIN